MSSIPTHPTLLDRPAGYDLDSLLDAFEDAWQRGEAPSLDGFLPPPEAETRRALLEELVKIDLEYRWRPQHSHAAASPEATLRDDIPGCPMLERYLARYPELAEGGVAAHMVGEEFRVRLLWGDRPPVAEYLARFPHLGDSLGEFLEGIQADLAVEYDPSRTLLVPLHGTRTQLSRTESARPEVPGHEIVGLLGRGGMGVVYKARQLRLNRLVAVKVVLSGAHAGANERARFQLEAESAARLVHPNIVQIYEVGQHEGRPFVVLELVEGGTLAEAIQGRPWPAPRAARLVETLARAIHAAHQKGIIHRDLKPTNILLAAAIDKATDAEPVPKISDFGLAKWLDMDPDSPVPPASGRTQTGVILGSPSYMAPEQAAGDSRAVGAAADQYALGAMLYELLTGRPPFQAPSVLETLEQVRSQPPVPPSRLQPGVPRDLETIALMCLEKDPRRRYAGALELGEDLHRFRNGEPIAARPVPPWERLWKWAVRRKAVAALIGVSILAVLTLLAGSIVYNVRLDAAKRLAEARQAQAERHFRKALEAVSTMLTKVGAKELADTPETTEVRRQILNEALRFLQGLLVEHAGRDPRVRREMALVRHHLALVLGLLGEHERGIRELEVAVREQSSLVREFPRDRDYRRDLGSSRLDLGLSRGGTAGEAEVRAGLALLESLGAGDVEARTKMATGYNTLANQVVVRNDTEAGLRYHHRALELYEALARADPEAHGAGPAMSHYNLGTLYYSLGRLDEAEAAFRRAIALYEPRAQDRRNARGYLSDLAECQNSLGILLMDRGHAADGEELLRRALASRERLARLFPLVPKHRGQVARAHHTLGVIQAKAGHADPATASYLKAIELDEALAAEYPDDLDYRLAAAGSASNLALLYAHYKRFDEAEPMYRKALAAAEAYERKNPGHPVCHDTIISAGINLGDLLIRQGRAAEALPYLDRSVSLSQPVVRTHPELIGARGRLRAAHGTRARARLAAGQADGAVADWEGFLALNDAGDRVAYRFEYTMALARAGRHAKVAEQVDLMAARKDLNEADFYNLACFEALALAAARTDKDLASQAREAAERRYAGAALGFLERARNGGFFQDPANRAQFAKDTDLDALRTSDEFRAVLRRIEAEAATPKSPG
jgi:tetratricopeptide (TPR) repeat protein